MPGKLDREAHRIAAQFQGSAFVLVAFEKGGLSVALAATPAETIKMPATLRHLADEMEKAHGLRSGH